MMFFLAAGVSSVPLSLAEKATGLRDLFRAVALVLLAAVMPAGVFREDSPAPPGSRLTGS